MDELVVEIHVPLVASADVGEDDYPFPWILAADEFLQSLDGDGGGELYDDGEEMGEEYVFFVAGATEPELLALALRVAGLDGMPGGAYAVVTDGSGGPGGRKVSLTEPWPGDAGAESETTLPPLTPPFWFSVHASAWDERHGTLPLRKPYDAHLGYLQMLLNRDRRWWDWWEAERGAGSTIMAWVRIGREPVRRTRVRLGKDYARRELVDVTLDVSAAELEVQGLRPARSGAPGLAMAARAHLDEILRALMAKSDLEIPSELLLPTDTAQLERERRQHAQAEGQTAAAQQAEFNAWNRQRSSEHVWRGRAPDAEVDALVAAVKAGKRIVALPQMIADLRHRNQIPIAASDARQLADAGYSEAEIAVILGAR